MKERTVEQHLIRQSQRLGWEAPKWVSPGNAGVHDRIIIGPDQRIGFLEVKRPGEGPRPLQLWWIEKLRSWGFHSGWADSHEGVDQFLAGMQR
jgi:hypothetical protein